MESLRKQAKGTKRLRHIHSAVCYHNYCHFILTLNIHFMLQLQKIILLYHLIILLTIKDYFIFSRYFNFSNYKPIVIGRKKVDNYLLWIPHRHLTNPTPEEQEKGWTTYGHLLDSSFGSRE